MFELVNGGSVINRATLPSLSHTQRHLYILQPTLSVLSSLYCLLAALRIRIQFCQESVRSWREKGGGGGSWWW